MIEIILLIIFLCFLINVLCVGGGLGSVGICFICVALLVFRFIVNKKSDMDRKKLFFVYAGSFLVIAACIIWESKDTTEYITESYETGISQTVELLEKEEFEEAYNSLHEVEETYGKTEAVMAARIAILLQEEEYESALKEIKQYPEKHSYEYYTMLETIYLGMGEEKEEELWDMYLEAARDWPTWQEIQLKAGMVQYERANYQAAEYFFLRVYEMDQEDSLALYFLGITEYELQKYSLCLECFAKSYEAGATDDMIASMQEYIHKILEEV